MSRHEATETSPLLPQPGTHSPQAVASPNGLIANVSGVNDNQDEDTKPTEDEESQTASQEGATQYQGMPEVKAKLAYIVPAISIGVYSL